MVSPQPAPRASDVAVGVVEGDELGVGLAELLDEHPRQPIADQEDPEDAAGPGEGAAADGDGEDHEEEEALEGGLVELRRVARAGQQPVRRAGLGGLAGEDHRPGGGRRAAPELAVDEVGEAAEEEADRGGGRDGVADAEDGQAVAQREADDAGGDAEKAAVEGHAALPDGKDFRGMGGEVRRLVEEDVAEAPAEDDAEDHPGEQVVGLLRRERRLAAPERRAAGEEDDVAPAEEKAGDVGERIPADGELDAEELDRKERRVDVREGNDMRHRGSGAGAFHRARGSGSQAAPRTGGRSTPPRIGAARGPRAVFRRALGIGGSGGHMRGEGRRRPDRCRPAARSSTTSPS